MKKAGGKGREGRGVEGRGENPGMPKSRVGKPSVRKLADIY